MTNSIIKIDWMKDTYYNEGEIKLKGNNFPLDGIYEDEHGSIHYFKNGKRHNENGPAYIEKSGYTVYCINGGNHRIDGPAAIYSNGEYTWCINGHHIEKETMDNWLEKNDISLDWNIWSNEDKMLFALHWCDYKG